jgi:predicted permease
MLNDLMYTLRAFFSRQSIEHELQEELQYHLEREAEKYRKAGAEPEEAMRRARLVIGGPEQVRQQCREARGTRLADDLLQDLRYGVRTLTNSPGFSIVTVLTLALGVGACTAIFSIVNAVLIRSLPYGDAGRLVYLLTPNPNFGNFPVEAFDPSYADFFDLQRQSHSYSSMTAFEQASYSSTSQNIATRVGGAQVDGNFFSTLQSFPETGRAIGPEDDRPGHNNVVVISHALWQSMFAGSTQILSKFLRLDGRLFQIIGVMPPGFGYPHSTDFPAGVGSGNSAGTDVWVPLALSAEQKAVRDDMSGFALARLKPGVSVRQAQAEMSTIMVRLDQLHRPDMRGWGAFVKPLPDSSIGPTRTLMWLLLGAVFLVLLIACGNGANLLLARAAARTHELGVRATLGAARGRMIRQMLTESLLLGLAGGLAGIVLAYGFLRGLLLLNPGDIPRMDQASIDTRVLVFTLITAVLTSVLFGILPALFASRINLVEFLKSGGNRGTVGTRNRLRSILIIGELGLVVILLVGAGLLLRSYINVESVQAGFSSSTVSMNIQLDAEYGSREQRLAFFRTLLGKIHSIPGVESAGVIDRLPLSNSESLSTLWVDGYENQKEQLVNDRNITPQYFSAMDIPLVSGRSFTDDDAPGHPIVAMVNQAFADKYFGKRNPIGLGIRTGPPNPNSPLRTVIGVVGNVHHSSLETPALPEMYEPLWQKDIGGVAFVAVRSSLPPDQIEPSMRAALSTVDPNLALSDFQTMGELMSQSTARRRFQTTLLSAFSGMAMLLGMVGVYGLLAYSVKQRTAEIGLRIALGASRRRVLGMILRQGVQLTIAGLMLGLAGALALTRILTSFLYGVSALDPVTFVAVPLLLLLATIMACFIPARRASNLDPMRTLRYE